MFKSFSPANTKKINFPRKQSQNSSQIELSFFKRFDKKCFYSEKKIDFKESKLFKNLELPLVDQLCSKIEENMSEAHEKRFRETAVFGLQHLYRTTVYSHLMFKQLGIKHFFLMGKPYSNSLTEDEIDEVNRLGLQILDRKIEPTHNYRQAFSKLVEDNIQYFLEEIKKDKTIKRILLLDEGGYVARHFPNYAKQEYEICCVQHTTKGVRGGYYLPGVMVSVATSAAKRKLEPPLIVEDIMRKIQHRIKEKLLELPKNSVFGVIGNGPIGYAIVRYLLKSVKTRIYVYDENRDAYKEIISDQVRICEAPEFILNNADCIFGSAGNNVISKISSEAYPKKIILISTSSEDEEYKTLVNYYRHNHQLTEENLLEDIQLILPAEDQQIKIINGGFPANFNQKPEEINSLDIQLIRALILGGCLQAILAERSSCIHTEVQQLDALMQKWIVEQWKPFQERKEYYDDKVWSIFNSIEEIKKANANFAQAKNVKSKIIQDIFEEKNDRVLVQLKM